MKNYILLLISLFTLTSASGQAYEFSLNLVGVNSSTGNYQFALLATPDFNISDAPSADMGAAIYIPTGYTLGNFATGNSGLQFFEWSNAQEQTFSGEDLIQLLRTDIVPNNFTHNSDDIIELVLFDIISDSGNGNNPTSGVIRLADNTDVNVTSNFYESYININLGDGNGTQDYFLKHTSSDSVNFETLGVDQVTLLDSTLSLYPNPASNVAYLKGNTSNLKQIEVFNIAGQRVLVKDSDFDSIDISQLESAVYLVKLSTTNAEKTIRLIKN